MVTKNHLHRFHRPSNMALFVILIIMVTTSSITSGQIFPPGMGVGDDSPKLSMKCFAEFAKHGGIPLLDIIMPNNSTMATTGGGSMTTQQKFMGLLASPMGKSR